MMKKVAEAVASMMSQFASCTIEIIPDTLILLKSG